MKGCSPLKFKLDITGGLSCTFQPKELRRVLSNLVNNSVEAKAKYIEVSLTKASQTAVIRINDNGKGIPAEILPRLGLTSESYDKKSGTGLGLLHAKRSLASWGGTLDITSNIGIGTTVEIRLPTARL